MMIKSVYYHTNFMVYSREQVNEILEYLLQPFGCERGTSRGLAREVLGFVDPILGNLID